MRSAGLASALLLGLVLLLLPPWPAGAVDYVVPPDVAGDLSGTNAADTFTINSGGTVGGSVLGLGGDDQITVNNGGTVTLDLEGGEGANTVTVGGTARDVIAGENAAAGTQSQGNTVDIQSTGEVDYIMGVYNSADDSSGGSNTINNAGAVNDDVYGSYNEGDRSSGGSNQLTNTGDVALDFIGSANEGDYSNGGGNTLTNTGVGFVWSMMIGSANDGDYSNGGGNTLTNTSNGGVLGMMIGSGNFADYSSGGGNTIINNGRNFFGITGSLNNGVGSSGGDNTIINNGSTLGALIGTENAWDSSSGGGNTIINNGVTITGIAGSYNYAPDTNGGDNTIINNGWSEIIFGTYNDDDGALSGGNNNITNTGFVNDSIYGTVNLGANNSGGGNTITNTGTVGFEIMGTYNEGTNSQGGSNTIVNSGTVADGLYGTYNYGGGSSGGGNSLTNSGTVGGDMAGTWNHGSGTSGGSNTIANSGYVGGSIFGSNNLGAGAGGSGNDITNTGTVEGGVTGSNNAGGGASGGGNTVNNSGSVGGDVIGSNNTGSGAEGGDNTITNSGTVGGDVIGSNNTGDGASGGGNTITNTGYVAGSIYGSRGGDGSTPGNRIINSGTVGGGIYAGPGNDGVIIQAGSSVGGVVDGQNGIDWLRFENAGSQNGGQFHNFESVSFAGGSTTLTGGLSVSGGATLESGELVVDGSLTSATFTNLGSLMVQGALYTGSLTNQGFLGGSGTLHTDLATQGVISPGNSIGTMAVDGSVSFLAGSGYVAELESDGACDLLSVTGAVTIDGGTLYTALPRALYPQGTAWRIIQAGGGVTGAFDVIDGQPDSVVLSLGQSAGSDGLSLLVQRQSYAAFTTNANEAQIGRLLDSLVPTAQGGMADMLMAMDWDMDGAGIARVLRAVQPEMYTAFTPAALEAGALFDRAMGRRLEERRQRRALSLADQPAASGPVEPAAGEVAALPASEEQAAGAGWSLWARGLGLWTDQEGSDGRLGHDQTTGGAALGADCAPAPWLLLGVAAGATRSELGWSRGGHDGDMDGMHAGLYAQANAGAAFARLTASYARLDNSATRYISGDAATLRAKADFSSELYAGGLALGYDWRAASWLIEPLAGLDYQHLEQDGFRESGAGELNMKMGSGEFDALSSNLGLRATRLFRAGGWELLPRAGLFWRHQLGDDQPQLDATFVDYATGGMTFQGEALPGDAAVLEAGFTAGGPGCWSLFADYRWAYASDYSVQALSAGLQVSW